MKREKMGKIAICVICGLLAAGSVQIGYADTPEIRMVASARSEMPTKVVRFVTIAFEQVSSREAYATVDASSTNLKTPYLKSKITVQESAKGAARYKDTSQVSNKTVKDSTILHTSFFDITSTKDYRIKVELSDVNLDGIESTATYYVKMQ